MAVGSPALSAWSEVHWDEPSTSLDLQHDEEAQGYATDDSWDLLDREPYRPQLDTVTMSQSVTLSNQCEHWASRKCQLTATKRQCCACVDTRPRTENGVYEAYIDGRGFVYEASRHQFYCHGCSVNPVETAEDALRRAETVRRFHEMFYAGLDAEEVSETTDSESRTGENAIVATTITETQQPTAIQTTAPQLSLVTQTVHASKRTLVTPSKQLHAQREAAARLAHQRQQMARGLLFQRTRCKHWVERDCQLRATEGNCCECIDKRPADTDYTVYIDGMGRLSGAEKYRHYCAGCKLVFEAQDGAAVSAGMPMDLEQFKWREYKRKKKKQGLDAQHGATTAAANQGKQTSTTMMTRHERIAELEASGAHANGGCIHWQGFGCKLKGPRCCACRDDRTYASRYIKYVDGEGDVMAAKRWEYYCPLCRKAGDVMEEKGMNDRSYIAMFRMGRV